MNKNLKPAILFMLLIIATVIPVTGVNESSSMFFPLQGDDDWNITANPPHMYSIPSGNVGIGTSSPERKLHVADATSGPNPIVYIQQIGTGRGLWVNTTKGMCGIVVEAGNNGLRILSAGGNGIIIHSAEEHGIRILEVDDYGLFVEHAGKDGVHVDHAGVWAGYFNGSGFFNGSLGIGTLTPSGRLDIFGDETDPLVSLDNSGSGEAMRVKADQSTALWIAFARSDGIRITDVEGHGINLINTDVDGLHIDNAGGHGVYVDNAALDGIRVNNAGGWAGYFNGDGYVGGYFGIGTASPIYLLDVAGSEEIVARFSGRVIGEDAVNDDEFVTKGQVKRMSTGTYFTPAGSDDPSGDVGDIAHDDEYFYIRTDAGWKRAAFESWSAPSETVNVDIR